MARPRGFAVWKPKAETEQLVGQVEQVLDEYSSFLPVTARQIFYRLVGEHGYDKTEQAYARLCETLVRARRSGMIPFASIRDDGTAGGFPQTFDDVADFWRKVRDDAKHYSRNRQAGQPVFVEFWCEAAGMVPQLRRVAYPFSVPVLSTGGFSSVTVTWEIARRALQRDCPTVFLHVGDYDPSGESIFDAQGGDAATFVRQVTHNQKQRETLGPLMDLEQIDIGMGAELRPKRIALTEEQVVEHELPTAPPKRSDSRSANWIGETCQLEAMPPDVLARTVRAAIEAELDLDRYQEEIDLEAADEDLIGEGLDRAEELA